MRQQYTRVSNDLPDHLHNIPVAAEFFIGGDDRHSFGEGSGQNQPVEGVTVIGVEGNLPVRNDMIQGNRQNHKSIRFCCLSKFFS